MDQSNENRSINLRELLAGLTHLGGVTDCLISGITSDSREVKSGDLFIALTGSKVNGGDFILDAIQRGAAAVLCESLPEQIEDGETIPIIVIVKLAQLVGLIAARFYGNPSEKLLVIGVTGTNGKTTVSQYIAKVLEYLGTPCAVIGTLGMEFAGQLISTINTTPDPITLQRGLAKFYAAGARAVAMEVSSHGLAQYRVTGVKFKLGVFTNLTRDHLNYHHTMEAYGAAKRQLFVQAGIELAVINEDDEFGQSLLREFQGILPTCAYRITQLEDATYPVVKVVEQSFRNRTTKVQLHTPWGDGGFRSHLLGEFNLSNLLAVITAVGMLGFPLPEILHTIHKLKPVKGRMESWGGEQGKPLVVVDYAHTPDALEKVLIALRKYCKGKLWCVFGCGGERDQGKRKLMGGVAERWSDHLVITNDNPRGEDPEQIVEDIIGGLLCPWTAEIEYDRTTAIQYAINNGLAQDVILVAGKGHEEYQLVGGEKIYLSDREIVAQALTE